MINRFHADITFFSAASVTKDGRIYDIFEEENPVRLAMFKNSSKVVFLSDSTKYGKVSPYYICNISDVDCVVADIDISSKFTSATPLPEIVY